MPITEFATLKILSPAALPVLHRALGLLSQASGETFRVLKSIKRPDQIYFFGHWNNLEHHQAWLVSDTNLALLEEVKGLVEVVGMFHIDSAFNTLQLPRPMDEGGRDSAWVRQLIIKDEAEELIAMKGTQGWRIDGQEEGVSHWVEVSHAEKNETFQKMRVAVEFWDEDEVEDFQHVVDAAAAGQGH